jgi:hypothetical protein
MQCYILGFLNLNKMDLVEKLKEYFKNNTKEKILEDWEKSKKYDEIGITADDFFKIQPAKTVEEVEEWCKRQLERKFNK